MTKEELITAFKKEFTEQDTLGNTVKGTPDEIISWIADKFCQPSIPPFSKAFTGLLDKNKRPIHEGDRIKIYYKGEYTICEVIYDTRHAAFLVKWPDGYINQYFMNAGNYEVVSDK